MKLMKYKRHKDKSYRVLFQGGAAALRYGIIRSLLSELILNS
jgi:hypothetical protein